MIAKGLLATVVAATIVGSAPIANSEPASAASETLSPLLQQALPNVAGKTFTSAIVTFPPGARRPTATATRSSTPTCSKAR